MNEQELFNQAVTHCATQGRRSISETGDCLYRGPDGLKCVIGALITDEEYDPEMEGKEAPCVLPKRLEPFRELCDRLQIAHDACENLAGLTSRLRRVADDFDLDASLVDTITRWS